MNKCKGKTPSLLSGKTVGKEIALRKIQCRRCKTNLSANDEYFKVSISQKMDFSKINKYCQGCFKNIISQTEKDLVKISKLILNSK